MSRQVAFLTMESLEGFFTYDHLLVEPMKARGWTVVDVPWNRPNVDWSQYQAVIIRSPWDYQQSTDAFLQVLEVITRSGTPLFNSLEVVRWNIRKTYLQDLERLGIEIVPTIWGRGLSQHDLSAGFEQFECDELVVKPVVGANADGTYRLKAASEPAAEAAILTHANSDYQLQPFLRSIVEEGEYSLFLFAGRYSHAILKRPAAGDFRVQEEHGGELLAVEPEPEARALAERVFAAIPFDTLYARIDLVRLSNGHLAVIEVELIEPSLYFGFHDQAPELFCDAFVATFSSKG